ncbi:MAG TPA: cupin domain-containing protein [Kofleriaceae bacterium]|nr:cupin domain-containing protein [Kofleriaceae bacterium]
MSVSAPGKAPIKAAEAPPKAKQTNYPEPFAARMAGRLKRPLGDVFGLTNFGVNHTRLAPGGVTALRHYHSRQDEFIYVIAGAPTLVTEGEERVLEPGMCVGFKAGEPLSHYFINRTEQEVVLLEVGDRSAGDAVTYPYDDIEAVLVDGRWAFTHKNGQPY